MRFIRLAQGSPEWLNWRTTGITASDVSCLFGSNPYKTEWKLWAEKSGLQAEDDIEGNPFVRRGKSYEHLLREHVVEDRNIGIFPACVEHDSLGFIKASLDGIDRNKRPWEFKLPSEGNFELVRAQRLQSEPAQRYQLQVQHQLMVTGASEGYLVFGRIDETGRRPRVIEYIPLIIRADPALHAEIAERARVFMQRVRDGVEPQKDPDRDLFAPTDHADAAKWQAASAEVIPMLRRKALLKEQLEALEADIAERSAPVLDLLGPNKFGEFAGLRVTRVDRKGSVDWSALVQAKGIDPKDESTVGPYRKQGSSNHQLTAL